MKALMIVNSRNRKSQFSARLIDVCSALSKKGYEIEIAMTQKKYDVYRIIAQRSHDVSLLVVAGGDGTIHEVTNALGDLKDKPEIMYFPTGTVNDFGHSLKIPMNLNGQLSILRKHNVKRVDSGSIGDKFFNYICAFGPFTRASYMTPHAEKNKFGKFAYYRRIIDEIPALAKSYYMEIEVDGERIEGYFTYALIINSTSVAGFRHFMKEDSIDDGYFNLVLVSKANAKAFALGIKHLIAGMKDNVSDEHYYFKKFKELKIVTDEKIRWTLDGEKGPVGSIDVKVIPGNIAILAP